MSDTEKTNRIFVIDIAGNVSWGISCRGKSLVRDGNMVNFGGKPVCLSSETTDINGKPVTGKTKITEARQCVEITE